LKPLPIDPREKVCHHVDALFGTGVSATLLLEPNLQFEYSRKTGRIKNFSINKQLVATLRTDGGLALTLFGAQYFVTNSKKFLENCIKPVTDVISFVSEGRSLFCKHVEWCGSNIKVGSDTAVIDESHTVLAVGVALIDSTLMKMYQKGVAVKVRQGIKSRTGE